MENVRAYIDDLLLTTKADWDDHLEQLDKVFTKLGEAGLKINAKKSFFGKENLNTWVIGLPEMVSCLYQRKLKPFMPWQYQKHANNYAVLLV